jgi:hypothetical protein
MSKLSQSCAQMHKDAKAYPFLAVSHSVSKPIFCFQAAALSILSRCWMQPHGNLTYASPLCCIWLTKGKVLPPVRACMSHTAFYMQPSLQSIWAGHSTCYVIDMGATESRICGTQENGNGLCTGYAACGGIRGGSGCTCWGVD